MRPSGRRPPVRGATSASRIRPPCTSSKRSSVTTAARGQTVDAAGRARLVDAGPDAPRRTASSWWSRSSTRVRTVVGARSSSGRRPMVARGRRWRPCRRSTASRSPVIGSSAPTSATASSTRPPTPVRRGPRPRTRCAPAGRCLGRREHGVDVCGPARLRSRGHLRHQGRPRARIPAAQQRRVGVEGHRPQRRGCTGQELRLECERRRRSHRRSSYSVDQGTLPDGSVASHKLVELVGTPKA